MKTVKLHLTEGTEFLTLRMGVMQQIEILEQCHNSTSQLSAAADGAYQGSVDRQHQALREAKALLEKIDCLEIGDHLEIVR